MAEAQRFALDDLGEYLLDQAGEGDSGRAAHTLVGSGLELRQTMIALLAGHELGEHESPRQATLQVLRGKVRLVAASGEVEGSASSLIVIPNERHSLLALSDAVVLLTVLAD